MKPKGTIYQSGKSGTHGEMILFLPFVSRFTRHIIRGFGAGMIAFAFLAFSFSFGPIIEKEISYKLKEAGFVAENEVVPEQPEVDTAQAEKVIEVQKKAQSYGVNSYFSVVIPKIDAASNVVANVDAADPDDYLEALKKGVAHAKGTYFPGQSGRVFLFSHSTDSPANFARYNAVFYLLSKLEEGDEIIVFFADKVHIYEVKEKVIAAPDDVEWLKSDRGKEELVLMTCDPPGTTWNRLMVIAEPSN